MPQFEWRDYLLLAKELSPDGRESVRRTCLGRAYYYAYNLALEKAKRHPDLKQLSIWGSEMSAIRNKADYHKNTQIRNWTGEIQKQIGRARSLELTVSKSDGSVAPPKLN
jgi:hypothetical protein